MRRLLVALASFLPLAACDGPQSGLVARGDDAEAILELTVVMVVAGSAILLLVTVLALLPFFAGRLARRLAGRGLVVGGGVVFPTVALAAFLVYALGVLARVNAEPDPAAPRIQVVGYQYWWEVRYLDPAGRVDFVTANQLVLPAAATVEVELTATDVIHSFWVPGLGSKMDLIPGRTNRLALRTQGPAVLRGQCAEYCGQQHALMAFDVEVLPADAYERWQEVQRAPAMEPVVALLAEGRDAFIASGCGACHTVRGTTADGTLGPDLTHVGGRPTIAAGSFPTNAGTIAGWIVDAQALKPGNAMPSFDLLDGRTVRAIATWLASLQ